jgi:alcohol dehydrogenase (cytochrome c)
VQEGTGRISVRALDAATGAVRGRFETIPGEGEPGNETWSGDSWKTGGGPSWLTGSYDPALGLLYLGIGNPNPDYNGDTRLGDNLYTNSVVALDAATGALRWYFQFTPHDERDWDALQIPVLLNAPDGTGRPLLLWANRNGFYYVLDRATGQFLRGRAFVEQTWADGLDSAGRPRSRPEAASTREGVLVYPGATGATNWWSPTYHPGTGLFYVPANLRGDVFFKGAAPEAAGSFRMGGGHKPVQEGTGRISVRALDALTGEQRWEHVISDTLSSEREHVGGLLSTGGDLVFGGAEDRLVALDAIDGRRLWSFRSGSVHAAPITYLVNGRQQVTIAAGRALLTFGLGSP